MLWLWIIGAMVLLFLLFGLIRIGVRVRIDAIAAAWITVGPLKIQVAPSKPEKKKKEQKKPKKKKEKPQNGKNILKNLPKLSLEDIRSAMDTLGPPLKRALRRTRRSIRVDPLRGTVTIGGADDPAAAAEWFGLAHAAVWTVMPAAEQLLAIPNPSIHIGLDFDVPKTKVTCEFGISIRIGTLIAVGFGTGIPALRWFLAWRKKKKTTEPPEKKEDRERSAPGTAA